MASALRCVGQLFSLLGALLVALGLDVGTPQPRNLPPGMTFEGSPLKIMGLPAAVVRSEEPWMLFVGLGLVILGAGCGFVGEVMDWIRTRHRG